MDSKELGEGCTIKRFTKLDKIGLPMEVMSLIFGNVLAKLSKLSFFGDKLATYL